MSWNFVNCLRVIDDLFYLQGFGIRNCHQQRVEECRKQDADGNHESEDSIATADYDAGVRVVWFAICYGRLTPSPNGKSKNSFFLSTYDIVF